LSPIQAKLARLIRKARRRAALNAAPVNDLTRKEWEAIKTQYGYRCVYCHKKPKRLEMDHIIPLSKGGSHTASNIVPACRSCNASKGAGPVLKPIQPVLLLA
jgi:5-methylcytosine-specific restriction endonuclease McrA